MATLDTLGFLDVKPIPSFEDGFGQDGPHEMLRSVLNLFERWSLSDPQTQVLLCGVSEEQIRHWRNGEIGFVSVALISRLVDLLEIHAALCKILKDEAIYDWVRRPSDFFGGKSALAVMLWGGRPGIRQVLEHLNTERGG